MTQQQNISNSKSAGAVRALIFIYLTSALSRRQWATDDRVS